jgi:SAM-dependent methyltransferase/uncharacterized protein YbaR (Trm112 family)
VRYGLLDLAGCQQCHAPLTSFTVRERDSEMPQALHPAASRVPAGAGVGPVAPASRPTPVHAALQRHAGPAGDPARNFSVEIDEGLLVCAGCGRWYPVIGQLPEILPDHLRDGQRDLAWFDTVAASLPADLRDALSAFTPGAKADGADAGAHYKSAEMSIVSKVTDPQFFGPGYSVPFNMLNPEFSLFLVAVFGTVVSVMRPRRGDAILDSGCGYAWTTEWLHRSGLQAIGVDITRVYLEIAVARMGAARPHLIVADVENLPLQPACVDAILAYESFHHIPDRRRAMAGYDRALRPGGRVVFAEPNGQHEASAVAVDAMEKYGILERGMELDDVLGYAEGTGLTRVEQVYVSRLSAADAGREVSPGYLEKRRLFDANIFLISRGGIEEKMAVAHSRRDEIWRAAKYHVKRAMGLLPAAR